MTFQVWAAFLIAAGIVVVIPGPTIISVISLSIAHGRRAVIPLVIGVTLGDFVAMSLSLLGLGAVLSASAALFNTLKMIGALYLIYLGLKLWRSDPVSGDSSSSRKPVSGTSLIRSLFVTTALNPKSIAFFIAFLPLFVNPAARVLPQLLVLEATFLFLAAVNAAAYAFFSGHLREKVQTPQARRWFNRCGGTALIGAGLLTATMRRSS
ncbi:MAG: LysE family translocator [Desulfobacteraceae bacterium]|nr:MAG: LysE family translocator [Desulfobacteraceae bacterium]